MTTLLQRATSKFYNEWATSDFLQRETSTTSNERILQRVTSDFLQRVTLAISNKWILQQAASDFLQWTTSATSREGILPLLELN